MHVVLALIAIEIQPMNQIVNQQRSQNSPSLRIQPHPTGTSLDKSEYTLTKNDNEEPFMSFYTMIHVRRPLHIIRKQAIGRRAR